VERLTAPEAGRDGDVPTGGMIELRHVAGSTRPAYNAIYGDVGLRHVDRFGHWLLDLLDVRPGQRLLDVACGEAQLPALARARGMQATGVDLSEVALGRGLAGRPNFGLAAADGEALPFADGQFDLVTNIGSLEHYADPVRGAREMARVLAPAGRAAVLLPNTFGLRWNVLYAWRHGEPHDDGQPLQRYGTRRQWSRLLAAGGLVAERVVAYERLEDWPAGPAGWLAMARHPSRILVPLAGWLPVDMASMFIFLCRRA
jgi:SAM-dependent methyltransferase